VSTDSQSQSQAGGRLEDYRQGPVIKAIATWVVPQLDEFDGNALSDRFRNQAAAPDLRVRMAGNELLTGMLLNCMDAHTYSVFVSEFSEASVGGPSPERDQLELLQYPRFTLWREGAPDLVADRVFDTARARALLLASARNLSAVYSITPTARRRFLGALDERTARNSLAAYGRAVLHDLSSGSWVFPGPLPPRV